MDNKFLVGVLVILMLLVSGLYFKGSTTFGASGTRMPNGISADSTSPVAGEVRGTTLTITSTSAFAGVPTFTGGSFTADDVTVRYQNMSLTAATTTVCALQSPSATSTLVAGGIRMTVSSTTAATITIARAATAYATTTVLGNAVAISANAQATQVATTTTANLLAGDFTFAPSTWFVVGLSGGTGTFSPTGTCSASWMTI